MSFRQNLPDRNPPSPDIPEIRSFAGRRISQKRLSISPHEVAAGHDREKRVVVDNSRFRAEGWIVQPRQDRSYPGCDRLIDDL
jgi:hypothetical protein